MRIKKAEIKQIREVNPAGFDRQAEIEITLSTSKLTERQIEKLFDIRPSERFDVTIKDSKK